MIDNIVKLWPYASLAARWEDDRNLRNTDPTDFIFTTLKEWHTVRNFKLFKIKHKKCIDYSYLAEIDCSVDRKTIIAHLGTDNKAAWIRNIFGTLRGFFFPFNGMNPAFGIAGWRTYKTIYKYIKQHPYITRYPIYNVMHSRGVRGNSMSFFLAEHNIFTFNYGYCVPPIWTRKGLRLCKRKDLQITNIFSPGDPVDNLGFFKFKHYGNKVKLRRAKDWQMSNIPFGPHSYSAVTHNLIETYKTNTEAIEYLRKRAFVDEK